MKGLFHDVAAALAVAHISPATAFAIAETAVHLPEVPGINFEALREDCLRIRAWAAQRLVKYESARLTPGSMWFSAEYGALLRVIRVLGAWPDEAREIREFENTGVEHYFGVDLEVAYKFRSSPQPLKALANHGNSGKLIHAIPERVLQLKSEDETERAIALAMVVHLLVDAATPGHNLNHQGDQGLDSLHYRFGDCDGNAHSLLDGLANFFHVGYFAPPDPEDSHQLARGQTYEHCLAFWTKETLAVEVDHPQTLSELCATARQAGLDILYPDGKLRENRSHLEREALRRLRLHVMAQTSRGAIAAARVLQTQFSGEEKLFDPTA